MTSFDKIYTTMLRIVSKNRQKSPEMKRFGIKNRFIRVCDKYQRNCKENRFIPTKLRADDLS